MDKKKYSKKTNTSNKNSKPMVSHSKSKSAIDDWRDRQVGNDPAWYYTDARLGEQIASLPYNKLVGMPFNVLSRSNASAQYDYNIAESIPVSMRIDFVPAYGSFHKATDAMNIAARAAFAFVRKANSGSTNYEASDLMTYYMAMDQLYLAIHFAVRVYQLAKAGHLQNRALPRDIVEHHGFKYTDLIANHANYGALLNVCINRVNRHFAVPKAIKIFLRRAVIGANVFTDTESDWSQLYFFRPLGFYEWDGTVEGGSSLKYKPFFGRKANTTVYFGDLLSRINAMITNLVDQQDIAIMCGDVVKAYGAENCYQLKLVDLNTALTFVYSKEVLNQIENMQFWASIDKVAGTATWQYQIPDIIQSANVLSSRWIANANNAYSDDPSIMIPAIQAFNQAWLSGSRYINSRSNKPTWEENLENTRLIESYEPVNDSSEEYYIQFGLEKVMNVSIMVLTSGGVNKYYYCERSLNVLMATVATALSDTAVAELAESMGFYQRLVAFDWHPFLTYYFGYSGPAQAVVYSCCPMGEYHMATLVSNDILNAIHDTVAQAVFNFQF